MPRRLSLSDLDVEVLEYLDRNGPTPMADLFWRFYATDEEREQRELRAGQPAPPGSGRSKGANYRRGHKQLTELAHAGFLTISEIQTEPRGDGPTCSHPGCRQTAKARGLCDGHYIRQREGRDMNAPLRPHPPKQCAISDLGRAQLRILDRQPAV